MTDFIMSSLNLELCYQSRDQEIVQFKTRKIVDIPYDPCTHAKHYLNVHLPDIDMTPDTKLPVVIHVHGGGWVRGDRNHYFYGGPFMGDAFANRGLVTVVISYRVRPQSDILILPHLLISLDGCTVPCCYYRCSKCCEMDTLVYRFLWR